MIPEGMKRASADPLGWARQRSATGKKMVGYLPPDVPVEIIHASGAQPLPLTGPAGAVCAASGRLQDYACFIARRGLSWALTGEIDFLDAVVLPVVCDTTRCLSHIWRRNCERPFLLSLLLPRKRNGPEARAYLLEEFSRLKEGLEECLGVTISRESLRQSICSYNRLRRAMREIHLARLTGRLGLCNADFQDLVRSSLVLPPEEGIPCLEGVIHTLREMQIPREKRPIRVYLSGKVAEPLEIFSYLDELGCAVVGDDLWDGDRSFSSEVAESGDPMEALSDHYVARPPLPVFSVRARRSNRVVVDGARRALADAVILLYPRYCEAFSFDYPALKMALRSRGIPHLLLELELEPGFTAVLRRQLETFMEVLRSRMAG